MKKLLKVAMLSFLLVGGLSSCSSSSSGITLTIWEDESNIETLEVLADEFITSYKKAYPLAGSLKIRFVEQTEKSAIEKLSTVGSTGNGPDILAITHDTVASGVKAGTIDEVEYSDELENRISEEAISSVTYNNKIYGYPITAESMTLMYNKDILSSTDVESFASLLASGKKIALDMQVDGGYYTYGFNSDSVLFGEDGKTANSVNIGTPNAVTNWTNFVNKYTDTVISMTPETSISMLSIGSIAGVIASPFLYSSVIDSLGKDKVGLATLPSIDGNKERPFSGYKCYAVNRYSKNPSLAHKLANFLTSNDAQEWRLAKKSYLPVAKTYTDAMNQYISDNEHLSIMQQSLEESITMPNIEQMANFWKPFNNAVSNMWGIKSSDKPVSEATIKSTLDEVTSAILK